MAQLPNYRTIRITRDGKNYSGTFLVKDGMVTVIHGQKKKTTQIGGLKPAEVARLLLGEMVGK